MITYIKPYPRACWRADLNTVLYCMNKAVKLAHAEQRDYEVIARFNAHTDKLPVRSQPYYKCPMIEFYIQRADQSDHMGMQEDENGEPYFVIAYMQRGDGTPHYYTLDSAVLAVDILATRLELNIWRQRLAQVDDYTLTTQERYTTKYETPHMLKFRT